MSIAQAVLGPSKLRQERHVLGPLRGQDRVGDLPPHAAPYGAWMVFPGASSIDMALLPELS